MKITYTYQREADIALARLTPNTIDEQSHKLGMMNAEPITVCIDSLLRYARAYSARFDGEKLANDGVLGRYWLDSIKAIRGLCNGDGAVAYERGRTTDSKSNGAVESMFWAAIEAAGFTEADF